MIDEHVCDVIKKRIKTLEHEIEIHPTMIQAAEEYNKKRIEEAKYLKIALKMLNNR